MSNSNILKIGSLLNKFPNNGSKIELSQELKDALVGVWSAYGKSNDSTDRNIIKNKIKDKGGDFVISNAAYKLNSGYGKYEVDFTTWSKRNVVTSNNDNSFSFESKVSSSLLYYSTTIGVDTPSFKIKANISNCLVYYYYINDKGTLSSISILESGEFELPISHNTLYNGNIGIGFEIGRINGTGTGTITQIPSFEGAFVTDGIDDLITSTKTVQEMLGGSNEITVVSMIHGIGSKNAYTNVLREYGSNYIRNTSTADGKTGIYGYTCKDTTKSIITDILGDKNDYKLEHIQTTTSSTINSVFSVAGWRENNGSMIVYPVAWYWTIIANKVLTTDQINQVIAYFNLDRTLNPDILCNTIKQGITNENHAEFGDKLIDFSGNGRDIQLNNLAWDGDSGIGKYEVDFLDSSIWNSSNSTITSSKIDCKNAISHIMLLYYSVGSKEYPDIPSFKVIKTGADIDYSYIDETGSPKSVKIVDGVNILPASHNTLYSGSGRFCGFGNPGMGNSVTITQIPSHAGGLCLDGINDFGKVTGMPIYKDYTVITDYVRISAKENAQDAPILSKSESQKLGAFMFNTIASNGDKVSYSFGYRNIINSDDTNRKIFYQSKYINNGQNIDIYPTFIDSDKLWLGTYRDNDYRFIKAAIYSLMSFPYSMSEFLIERQLKKHKLGTLYPDMVEFRPIINGKTDLIKEIKWFSNSWSKRIYPGDYITKGVDVTATILLNYNGLKLTKASYGNEYTEVRKQANWSETNNIWDLIIHNIGKSPQKIDITIEQDENYVQWNPVVESNAEYSDIVYLNYSHNIATINVGDYINVGDTVGIRVILNSTIDEVVNCKVNGQECEIVNVSPRVFDCKFTLTSESPQKINITIDEYIRFEDIVQPYPLFFEFTDENNNLISWGGKAKVGSTITRTKGVNYANLLEGLFTITNPRLNGVALASAEHIVEKSMVFTCTATWAFDNNEPKCILSPRLLRIPNSSYKILGYIPDISGHGNHGKINNSAYAGASGANGYLQNFSGWTKASEVSSTDSVISSSNNLVAANGWIAYVTSGTVIPTFKVEISGIPVNGNLRFEGSDQTLVNGVNTIQGITTTKVTGFYISSGYDNDWSNLKIEQIGEYEGAYCFDGVDDFVTIPTTVGGKQVLMKVNWDIPNASTLYDQRGRSNEFAIYTSMYDDTGNIVPAYQARNNGQTYIDGILNSNIKVSELKAITHNITITNELSLGTNNTYPVIGANKTVNGHYANMALYDFMLFDNISTDDKIKELNEYVGTEGNFVEWNPTITTNISSTYAITPNIRKSDGIIVKLVKGNIYSTSITGNLVLDIVPPNKDLDEVTNVIIDGKSYTPIKYQYADYYRVEIPLIFPQEINVIIDEYITYETIEQPYPIFLNYIDKETNKTYTWGDKVKVDSILKISGYKNLFENGDTSLGGSNGYSVNGSSELIALGTLLTSEILVNKINTGVRSSVIWNLNTPKPLFAYDPSIINNVGLKNLGYLPDITGQGRHLLLNEFAYEGMSGVNGYPVVFGANKTWEAQGTKDGDKYYIYTSSANKFDITQIKISSSLFYTYIKRNGELTSGNKDISSFKLKVTGLDYDKFYLAYYYLKSADVEVRNVINITSDGIYELPKSFASDGSLTETNLYIGLSFIRKSSEIPDVVGNVNVIIEILPNYEGALCFDGINDYGTVSNLPSQYIKTLLMKVNWMKDSPMLLYDQRGGNYFGILTTQESDINNTKIAYQARNPNGKTYIDGIENNYIETYTLKDITHNITITNSNVNTIVTPIIGSNSNHSINFAQMAMYKVMGLPEIPSDEEIKILNNWAGIEAKVELPPYYWDAYGKTNLDADRGYIKDQVSLQLNNDTTNNNSLENFNFGYKGMSGYNGYPVVFGANETWEVLSSVYSYTSDVTSTTIHVTMVKNAGTGLLFSYVKKDGALTNIKEIPAFRVTIKGLEGNSKFGYRYLATEDAIGETLVYLGNGTHELAKSFAPTEALLNLTRNAWVGIFITPMVEGEVVFDCDITIEVLPEYENGLAYDGITNYSKNANIPAFNDFTAIMKRKWLKKQGCPLIKGSKVYEGGNGNALLLEWDKAYNFVFYKRTDIMEGELPDNISFITPTNYNGNIITRGSEQDTNGICIAGDGNAGFANMVFYKLMLYSKTLPLLQINYLKNLIEKDEIINLNNPIFIQK